MKETLQFSHSLLNDTESLPAEVQATANRKLEDLVRVLKLSNAIDTYIGDELIRGVSGGERKRVTIAEMIVGLNRVAVLDEISTGLDSATITDIVQLLRTVVDVLRMTGLVSLLQPPPEVYSQLDNIMLMREGRIVYHGMLGSTTVVGLLCACCVPVVCLLCECVCGRGGVQYGGSRCVCCAEHQWSRATSVKGGDTLLPLGVPGPAPNLKAKCRGCAPLATQTVALVLMGLD